ncbi:MAG: hypothetical protein A2869_01930 [Candidatus Levybacteria bacterium RIFCSPHIGHO2_01_FULL_40_58]|nr:MAG: hypothetical protein A2869_01930 [Candidatus Levybacteria bacterium RIFCSPHIGHO2_01_FULL_40_58]
MNIILQIGRISLDLISDLESCLNRAKYLLSYSSAKNEKIFLAIATIILLVLIFSSHSKAGFYINLAEVIFISLASFFIFVSSDTFWFLRKKVDLYKLNIRNKKNILTLIQGVKNDESRSVEGDIEEQIRSIVKFNSIEYKIHARRCAIEISFFLIILLFTFPLFFFFNIALFCAMFVYVYLYEQQSVNQVFDDIASLIFLIGRLHAKNNEKCKRFIKKNKQQEVRDLTRLYGIVLTN